jgi:hypothetical protein
LVIEERQFDLLGIANARQVTIAGLLRLRLERVTRWAAIIRQLAIAIEASHFIESVFRRSQLAGLAAQ